jgi:hypothetical protein
MLRKCLLFGLRQWCCANLISMTAARCPAYQPSQLALGRCEVQGAQPWCIAERRSALEVTEHQIQHKTLVVTEYQHHVSGLAQHSARGC